MSHRCSRVLVLGALIACSSGGRDQSEGSQSATVGAPRIALVAQRAAANGSRVYAFKMDSTTTASQVQAFADTLPYKERIPFFAYFYEPGATIPGDQLSRAGSFDAAQDAISKSPGASKWRFVYMRAVNQASRPFVIDCRADPSDPVCS